MPRETKKWELFPGRNKFCLDGRIMMAPDVNVFYINVFLIVGTTLLFFIFDCPYLTTHVSLFIPVIAAIMFLFVMSALLRTSFTDPGIIPRATSDEAFYIEKQIKLQNCGDTQTDRPPPRTKEVVIKGQPIKLKYCFTCRIFRPPRASHCSLCDNCVEHFDHHCPWVGNCVGRRNYRYFYLFTVSLSFYIAFVFICTCSHLYYLSENRQLLDSISESPASVIVLLVTFFSCWSVFGLAGFHTYLAASNQTTNEDIKGSFTNKRGGRNNNPYSEGSLCSNCCHVLCGPVPSSLIDSRGFVTPDLLAQEKQLTRQEPSVYNNINGRVYNNNNYNQSPLQNHHQNGIKFVSSCEKDLNGQPIASTNIVALPHGYLQQNTSSLSPTIVGGYNNTDNYKHFSNADKYSLAGIENPSIQHNFNTNRASQSIPYSYYRTIYAAPVQFYPEYCYYCVHHNLPCPKNVDNSSDQISSTYKHEDTALHSNSHQEYAVAPYTRIDIRVVVPGINKGDCR